ncbi:MAG: hypothetical protein ACP5VR_00495 [Acidimicrobiales bacterium]
MSVKSLCMAPGSGVSVARFGLPWGRSPKGSTARQGDVGRLAVGQLAMGRLTATLIFVGSHMSGIRRKLPLTTFVLVDKLPTAHRCDGDQPCCGGALACCGVLGHGLTGSWRPRRVDEGSFSMLGLSLR